MYMLLAGAECQNILNIATQLLICCVNEYLLLYIYTYLISRLPYISSKNQYALEVANSATTGSKHRG